MNNKQWPDNIFDEMRNLINVERELVNISYGLGIVGLNNLQEKISNLSDQISIIRTNTKNAVSDHISADLKTAQEMSGTILKAALLKKDENTGEISIPQGLEKLFS